MLAGCECSQQCIGHVTSHILVYKFLMDGGQKDISEIMEESGLLAPSASWTMGKYVLSARSRCDVNHERSSLSHKDEVNQLSMFARSLL